MFPDEVLLYRHGYSKLIHAGHPSKFGRAFFYCGNDLFSAHSFPPKGAHSRFCARTDIRLAESRRPAISAINLCPLWKRSLLLICARVRQLVFGLGFPITAMTAIPCDVGDHLALSYARPIPPIPSTSLISPAS